MKKTPQPEVLALIVSIVVRRKKKGEEFMKREAYMVSISLNYILIRF